MGIANQALAASLAHEAGRNGLGPRGPDPAARCGAADPRLWALGRISLAAAHQPAAAHMIRTVEVLLRPPAKCLVLDLDNSLCPDDGHEIRATDCGHGHAGIPIGASGEPERASGTVWRCARLASALGNSLPGRKSVRLGRNIAETLLSNESIGWRSVAGQDAGLLPIVA